MITVTIGSERDKDTVSFEGQTFPIGCRVLPANEARATAVLPNGWEVFIDAVYGLAMPHQRYKISVTIDGHEYSRYITSGETLQMTRENFDKMFYPITYHLDGEHKWRVPLRDLQEALAKVRIPSDTQENNHGT